MRQFIHLATCFFTTGIFAQTYFNKAYDINNTIANAAPCIEVGDSAYFLPSCLYLGNAGVLSLIKTDSVGDTIFAKNFLTPNYYYNTGASNSLIKLSDANYLLCGSLDDLAGDVDALLVKFNNDGDTLWTKTYGGGADDHANVVIEDPLDSGFVLIGFTQSYGQGASDYYMIKTDKNGNQLWYTTYGTAASEDAVSGIRTMDGGYILAGVKSNSQYVIKTNSAGNLLWQKNYTTVNGIAFVKELPDSNLIICGTKLVNGLSDQAYIAKADKLGNIIWSNTYGGTTTEILYAIPVILADGSIVCSGIKTYGNNIPYGYLLKVDANGNQQWERSYYKNQNIDNYFYDVKETSDGGFVMSGTCYVTNADAWLVKVDSNGCEVLNCNVGQEELSLDNSVISIYPNPSTGIFTIKTDAKNYNVEIYNMMGQVIMVAENKTDIDLSAEPKGIYFVKVLQNEKYYLQKIVIQ